MQNKREQLCKLLNLKPVYSMWINRGDLDNNYVKMTDKRYYKLISDNRWHFDDYNICPEILKEYVDFTKPENFVKLQLLQIQDQSKVRLGGLLCGFFNTDNPIDNFIKETISYLEHLEFFNPDKLKYIVNKAQETEWIY